jgi:hypothetical protein
MWKKLYSNSGLILLAVLVFPPLANIPGFRFLSQTAPIGAESER